MRKLIALTLLVLSFALQPLSAQQSATSTLHGDRAHPAHAAHWVDTRLYFGLGPADAPDKGVSEAAWRDFLDHEVTPRFPAGLPSSTSTASGRPSRSQPPSASAPRSSSSTTPQLANSARIEAIRVAWKKLTGDQSVMKVTAPADVSF